MRRIIMKSTFLRMAAVALTAWLGLAAGAANAVTVPTSLTVDGAVYTMTDVLNSPGDYTFTLNIDLTGYTGGGSYLRALAFNAGTYTSFNLISTPDGAGLWNYVPGGLDAGGCNGHGAPWACITDTANSGKGYNITSLSPVNQFTFEFTGITLTSDGVGLKANYVDINGKKAGSLISQQISPIPEPSTYAMLLAGLGLVGFSARRRNENT
jgi:PEP-CTERM motif